MWRIIFSPSPETLDFPFETQCDCETLLSLKTFTPPPHPPQLNPKFKWNLNIFNRCLKWKMKEPLFAVGLFTAGRKHHKKQEGGRMRGGPLRTHFLLHRFSLIKPEHSEVPPLVTECQFTAHYLCICVCVCQRERCVPDLGTFPSPGCRGGHAEHFVCS